MKDDLLELFLVESRELVARALDELTALESSPADRAVLEELFRTVHTLKGSVAIFDWPPFLKMLHSAEDILDDIRADRSSVDADVLDAMELCLRKSEVWLDALEQSGELPVDAQSAGAAITGHLKRDKMPEGVRLEAVPSVTESETMGALLADAAARGTSSDVPLLLVTYAPGADCFFGGDDPAAIALAVPGLIALRIVPATAWVDLAAYDPHVCQLRFEMLTEAPKAAVLSALRFVADQVVVSEIDSSAGAVSPAAPEVTPTASTRMVRVDRRHIDSLGRDVEELIVAKNALSQLLHMVTGNMGRDELARALRAHQAALGQISSRMHASLTPMRMIAVGPTLRRLPRIVRDLADRLGKSLEVEIDCEDMEADKSIVDALSEPLLHVLRNAVDHGAEPAADRLAAGKSERANLRLTARRMRDEMQIIVEDDGAGIDPERIRRAALGKGLVSAAALEAMTDEAVLELVFVPGFSTASAISDVSGRGVGMDAVRSAVERAGGHVGIASTIGRGTRITFTLPLTMLLTQVLVVEAGGELYGILQASVTELTRVPPAELVTIRSGTAFQFRDHAVPLLSLEELLGLPSRLHQADDRVVLTRVGQDLVGVSVGRRIDQIEAVVQPMRGLLAGAHGLAGTAMLGNGTVLLVLNLDEMIG